MNYEDFLKTKQIKSHSVGIEVNGTIHKGLFDFQKDVVRWALRRGRAALFEGCGLGKSFQELEWAKQVCRHEKGSAIILMPLAVSRQMQTEAAKFDYSVTLCESAADVKPGINVTNYEKLHKFDVSQFCAVVLDESSILKSYDGATRTQIIEAFTDTPYRLAATATPAPNDYMELGNHSEFLGVMTRAEMLATFFVHDGGDTSKWRLKGHAESKFWEWVCSWAVNLQKPSDLGYADDDFELPPLEMTELAVESNQAAGEMLFAMPASSLDERRSARKSSLNERVQAAAALCNLSSEQWLVWCDLNAESEALTEAILDSIEIQGSDSDAHKLEAADGFLSGKYRVLITKPSIFGWGMNWQHCRNMVFVGLSDSFEQFYQAVRRCWRFGQKHRVQAWIITSRNEGAVVANIKRKEQDAERMAASMIAHMADISRKEIKGAVKTTTYYSAAQRIHIPEWLATQ